MKKQPAPLASIPVGPIRFPADTYNELKAEADADSRSVSSVIRIATMHWIRHHSLKRKEK